jgi:tRNASer (uridine44-2'-O)-methyltransferase
MGKAKKSQRDVARLSGKPLSETLEPSSVLCTNPGTEEGQEGQWVTSPDLTEYGLSFSTDNVQETTFFLLANPGLNSTVLFRADILFDTGTGTEASRGEGNCGTPLPARDVPEFELSRTIVRRLIPRNSQLDRPLDQTCHFYLSPTAAAGTDGTEQKRFLAIYTPHVSSKEELPYYHPMLRSLAFLYDASSPPSTPTDPKPETPAGVMSIHILPWQPEPVHNRLERTLSKLLDVQIRLTKRRLTEIPTARSPYAPIKDNVIPRHRVQDTYSRLKTRYAAELCSRWVESTEPSKHVFEDLGVAAFLIEFWREMYGCVPVDERQDSSTTESGRAEGVESTELDSDLSLSSKFPGFVDIACGNGVLVYILLQEGYPGWGFDARRRKTWDIFPASVQEYLREEIYIPKPFADELSSPQDLNLPGLKGIKAHSATPPTLPRTTFIISNHADELTLWTPLLATILNPTHPQPFLAIPCCSHSLSGARYRYPPQTSSTSKEKESTTESGIGEGPDSGPKSGDLKALRASKLTASTPGSAAFNKSSYGTLTEKLVSLAAEVGYDIEKTLLRIPSTRNIGVLGRMTAVDGVGEGEKEILDRVSEIVARECARDGGLNLAARAWVERAVGLTAAGGGCGANGQSHAHV